MENGKAHIVWVQPEAGSPQGSRAVLGQRLAEAGYTVTVTNADIGAVVAPSGGQPPDLILLDLAAAGILGGLGANERTRDVPVILLAPVAADPAAVEAGLAAGAEDFLTDPISPALLKAQVRDYLAIGAQRRSAREQTKRVELLKIERDVQIARQIQLNFLPKVMPEFRGWEFAARFYPAREVAGDFYDAFTLTQGRRVAIVLADVCDKGVGAALFMALTRSLIRAFAQQHYNLGWMDTKGNDGGDSFGDPLAGLIGATKRRAGPSIGTTALMNAIVLTNSYIADNHLELNMFATMFFGILDPVTGALIYVNAGHCPPVLLGLGGAVKGVLKPTGPAVGMLPGADFNIGQANLEAGDTLLAYTDGVTDARDHTGRMFGLPRLMDILRQAPETAAGLMDCIDTTVHAHIGEADPFDDITLIAVRRQPAARPGA